MSNRMTWLAACVLLCSNAYGDEHDSSASNAHQHGPKTTVNTTLAARRGRAPSSGESKYSLRSADFSVYGTTIADVGATEVVPISRLPGSAGSNAAAGRAADSGRTAFLVRKEHDAAIRLLTPNIALRLKLSADGVYLNLVF